jgi:hypothetical protein
MEVQMPYEDEKRRTTTTTVEDVDENRDPITGEPGSHPVGTGVGAATGGLAGAAIGAAAGPVGAAVGGVIGAVTGGLAGHAAAEAVDPTVEMAYWRETYSTRPYAAGKTFDYYEPAYRYGFESYPRYAGRRFDQVESDLERGWDRFKDKSKLTWHEAKAATRDAFERLDTRNDDRFWRESFTGRPYYRKEFSFDDYEPAYRYGRESFARYPGKSFDAVAADLERGWDRTKAKSRLTWENAKDAVRDAWHRTERAIPGDADRDGR